MYIPTYQDMLDAHERIKPYINRTPIRTSKFLNELTGAELFFKCENFQEAGAFKVRGASNAVFGLSDEQAKLGVATHSSGNHASCLSYAAMLRGIPCNVVMPSTAPQAKKDTVRRYGGVITECEPSTSAREETFAKVQAASGGDFVHPYNDPRVIAGQGTCAKEFMEQVDGLDIAMAPIGGGGMISGTCLTLSHLAPEVQIIAAEPEQADDAMRSFKAGYIIGRCAQDDCRWVAGAAERADLAFRIQPCHRHFDCFRGRNHRCDEADVEAFADCHGGEFGGAFGDNFEEQRAVRRQAGWDHNHTRKCRSRQAAMDTELRRTRDERYQF